MKNNFWHSLGHAVLTVIYVAGVTWFLSHTKEFFGPEEPKSFVVPLFMLLLLVLSATITGTLVLGRPILLYLDGRRAEAWRFFGYTVFWLAVSVVVMFFVVLNSK